VITRRSVERFELVAPPARLAHLIFPGGAALGSCCGAGGLATDRVCPRISELGLYVIAGGPLMPDVSTAASSNPACITAGAPLRFRQTEIPACGEATLDESDASRKR